MLDIVFISWLKVLHVCRVQRSLVYWELTLHTTDLMLYCCSCPDNAMLFKTFR